MKAGINILMKNIEVICWVGAIVFLALTTPGENHFTLCPIAAMGFDFCPGCDLGHSVSLLLHGEFVASFKCHPLGLVALIMLTWRSATLINQNFQTQNK